MNTTLPGEPEPRFAPPPRFRRSGGPVWTLVFLALLFFGLRYTVAHFRRPGSMTVIEAQAMDMSVMKPPAGAVPVEVTTVSRGVIRSGATYTGSVVAMNDVRIAARVTGRIVDLPVYPGDRVTRGELLVQLDSDELRAKAEGAQFAQTAAEQDRLASADEAQSAAASQTQAQAQASQAQGMEQEAQATVVHAQASVTEAQLAVAAQERAVAQAQSQALAVAQDKPMAEADLDGAQAALADAQSEVDNARAMAQSAAARLPQAQADLQASQSAAQLASAKEGRSADLFKQGAISKEELEEDQNALQSALAKVSSGQSGVGEANSDNSAANAKVAQAQAGVRSAEAKIRSATAEVARADANIAAANDNVAQEQEQLRVSQIKVTHAHADTDMANARLAQADAGVQSAQAAAQGASANTDKAQHESQRSDAMSGEAGAELQEAQTVQGYTEIRAESDGIVSQRLAAPGALVDPGTQILEVSQIDPIRFQANVAQSDLALARVGAPVTITSPSGGPALSARLSAVFPSLDPASRTGTVEAVAPNPDGRFKPGQYVVMSLAGPAMQPSIEVPAGAIVIQPVAGTEVVPTGTTSSVWIMERVQSSSPTIYTCTMHPQIREDKPGDCPICKMPLTPLQNGGNYRARLVPIVTGVSDGTSTQVVSGLNDGAQVITRGFDDLKDGDAVVPTRFDANGPTGVPAAGTTAAPVPTPVVTAMPSPAMPESKPTPADIHVTVDGNGFTPPSFALHQGIAAHITFLRTTDGTCATSIVWPDFNIQKDLPLNQPVTITVTPTKTGPTSFACGMGMFHGAVMVQ